MTVDDFDVFVDRLVVLAEVFSAPVSTAAQLLYFEALKDLEIDAVTSAIHRCVQTAIFMPKPAELRRAVAGDPEDAIEAAWLEYKRVARRVGGYGSPTFSDPALAGTIEAVFGSWEAACWTDFTPEMWAAKRKEFGRVYHVHRDRVHELGPRCLPGRIEHENALRGYQAPRPSRLDGFTPVAALSPVRPDEPSKEGQRE